MRSNPKLRSSVMRPAAPRPPRREGVSSGEVIDIGFDEEPPPHTEQAKGRDEEMQQGSLVSNGETVLVLPSVFALGCLTILAVLMGAAGTALGIYNLVNNEGDIQTVSATPLNEDWVVAQVSTLEIIMERGYLNCGTGPADSPGFLLATGKDSSGAPSYAGLELDLCLMLASALFNGEVENKETGEKRYKITPIEYSERWRKLLGEEIDVVFRATYNMERDLYEPSVQQGFEFSFPYLLDGLGFGGIPANLECAERLDFENSTVCQNTQVCVTNGTTHKTIMTQLVPATALVVVDSVGQSFPSKCQVIASEMGHITWEAMKLRGYLGEYQLGSKVFSREPISMVTRQGDPRWTDFVEWILQAMVYAEEEGILKASSFKFAPSYVFGGNETNPHPNLEKMFENAIAVRGNYGEMYNYNLQNFLPRGGMNQLNTGDSPIMFSFPLGDVEVIAPEIEVMSPTIQAIKNRGFLNCGVNIRTGFAEFNTTTRAWAGFDVELCRALASALFDGVDQVVFTDLPAAQRFPVLTSGRVDVLARLTTWTLSRDVKEPSTGQGLSFSSPYFHDGLKFGGLGDYVMCADNEDVISPECQDLRICLLQGTTTLSSVQQLFRSDYIFAKLTFQEIINGLNDGSCNAIAGGFHDVALQSIEDRGYVGNETYGVGQRLFSKDPLALATRQDDALWSDFVRWIFWALVYAEENGITQATADKMPRPKIFGPLRTNSFYHAVSAVGNYGELYDRNFGDLIPRSGMHLLNTDFTPMMRSLPGIAKKS